MACRASHASSSARLSAAIQPDCLPCFEPVHSHAKKKPAASHTKPIRHASTDACTLPPMPARFHRCNWHTASPCTPLAAGWRMVLRASAAAGMSLHGPTRRRAFSTRGTRATTVGSNAANPKRHCRYPSKWHCRYPQTAPYRRSTLHVHQLALLPRSHRDRTHCPKMKLRRL